MPRGHSPKRNEPSEARTLKLAELLAQPSPEPMREPADPNTWTDDDTQPDITPHADAGPGLGAEGAKRLSTARTADDIPQEDMPIEQYQGQAPHVGHSSLLNGLAAARIAKEAGASLRPLTAKQEAFASLVANGHSATSAYAQAYDAGQMKRSTIAYNAGKLLQEPAIATKVDELTGMRKASLLRGATQIRHYVIDNLEQIASNPKASDSARVAALMGLGRVDFVGLFNTGKDNNAIDQRNPEQIKAELQAKLKRLGVQLPNDIKDITPIKPE